METKPTQMDNQRSPYNLEEANVGSSWIQTHEGHAFDFELLLAGPSRWPELMESISIRDIAVSLSRQCRFAGHTKDHYSVAEHSVLVMRRCRSIAIVGGWDDHDMRRLEAAALMHDASEAYLVDVPRPIKKLPAMEGYRQLEEQLEEVLARRFDLDQSLCVRTMVKRVDAEILDVERRDQLGPRPRPWTRDPDPPPGFFARGLPWEEAMELFLEQARRLRL